MILSESMYLTPIINADMIYVNSIQGIDIDGTTCSVGTLAIYRQIHLSIIHSIYCFRR